MVCFEYANEKFFGAVELRGCIDVVLCFVDEIRFKSKLFEQSCCIFTNGFDSTEFVVKCTLCRSRSVMLGVVMSSRSDVGFEIIRVFT